jgi:molybdopterin synthase sulfur carrier subunit
MPTSKTRALTLLYFAGVSEAIGKREETRLLPHKNFTIEALIESLQHDYPQLPLVGVRFAVNEEFVETSWVLSPGDTVAFIPPVSGG